MNRLYRALRAPWMWSGLALTAALGLAWAASDPDLLSPARSANGEVSMRIVRPASQYFRIEATADFAGWQAVTTQQMPAAGFMDFTDTGAPYSGRRFYRAVPLATAPVLTGDHLQTDAGDVIFHPVNHASFVMSWNGKTIYADPVGGSALYSSFPKADVILVSHAHGDHYNSGTLSGVLNAGGKILAPSAVYNALSTTLKASATSMANGATNTPLTGISVEAVPAYNLTTTNHVQGVGNGYVVTIGNRRIYISGDSEDIPEMAALPNIDVAFVCMNTPFTMDGTKAVGVVRAFKPKVVYPYHYRNGSGTYTDLNAFKAGVGQDLGIEVRQRAWY